MVTLIITLDVDRDELDSDPAGYLQPMVDQAVVEISESKYDAGMVTMLERGEVGSWVIA